MSSVLKQMQSYVNNHHKQVRIWKISNMLGRLGQFSCKGTEFIGQKQGTACGRNIIHQ